VAPAESLARFGAPVSRALAADLAVGAPVLARDEAARRIFVRANGAPLGEGETLTQTELANVLTALRVQGGADLYQGPLAARFAEAAAQAGARITVEDMRSVAATPKPSIIIRHDDVVLHFAPPPAVVGVVEAQLFAALAPRWRRAGADERAHLLAETELRVAQDRARWLAPDLSTTVPTATLVSSQHIDQLMASYRSDRRSAAAASGPLLQQRVVNTATAGVAAVDRDGSAVACTFTMNDLFGVGRIAGRTGMLLAAAPDDTGRGPQMLGPVLGAMARGGRIMFAGTSSGGWPQASAMTQVMLRTIVEGRSLEQAIDTARVHNPGDGDQVMVEAAVQARTPGFAPRGYEPSVVPALGSVNAIFCPEGLFENAEACQFRADRRGFGLAAGR
jgi:gamma-glutamyltranspeptidase/glutathione hydrolase